MKFFVGPYDSKAKPKIRNFEENEWDQSKSKADSLGFSLKKFSKKIKPKEIKMAKPSMI